MSVIVSNNFNCCEQGGSNIYCDLAVPTTVAGLKYNICAIIFIVYPSVANPERRFVSITDSRGTTGLTVWHQHVNLFSCSSVGSPIRLTNVGIAVHNGKKSIAINRDSTVTIGGLQDSNPLSMWWAQLAAAPPRTVIEALNCEENAIISITGIVALISSERKTVRSDSRDLLSLTIIDRTGEILIRSWHHVESEFARYLNRPLSFQRVRVTAYAGVRMGELLDGSGSLWKADFEGSEQLKEYWAE